ncbi:MAG TPA: hypothetical protein DCQ58_12395 [Saprospirales bacterium]|nr:hypothetical protein [Saprospirales bacterium]
MHSHWLEIKLHQLLIRCKYTGTLVNQVLPLQKAERIIKYSYQPQKRNGLDFNHFTNFKQNKHLNTNNIHSFCNNWPKIESFGSSFIK